jgi:hypothetical protein
MQVLMTASKQSQDGTGETGSILTLHETYQRGIYSRELLMIGREAVIKICTKLTSVECTVENS